MKYFITRNTNLFITVMSELLYEGCGSFYYCHSPPGFITQLLREARGLLGASKVQRIKEFSPLEKEAENSDPCGRLGFGIGVFDGWF